MKHYLSLILIAILMVSCSSDKMTSSEPKRTETVYHLDVTDPSTDIFNITVLTPSLSEKIIFTILQQQLLAHMTY